MRHQFTRTATVFIAVAATLAAAACSAGSSTTGTSQGSDDTNQKLVVGLIAEPANLDFTRTDGAAIPQVLLYNVYEGLVKLNNDGEIIPDLATSWKVSPDRLTYTFDLVEGAKFSNGRAFSAQDAAFSIDRVKTDWTISLKKSMDVVKDVKAVSPTRLEVTLSHPSNDWLYRMTTRVGAMFSRTGVDKMATNPVGTGPYTLKTWNRGDSISLQRNDSYWGLEPFFQTVTFKYFKDPTALNNALLTGTINIIGTVQAPESLAQFTSNPKYEVIEGTTNGEVVLSFNNGKAPFTDKRVRQAVRYAIDHKSLVDTCWAGRGRLIGSMVPPTDPWFEDLTGLYPQDVDKARSLLAEAGKSGVTLRLRVPNLPYAVSCGQVVKSQLEQAGFKVRLDQLEFPAVWLDRVFRNADYDMSIIAHIEPRDMGTVFGNPNYYMRYNNPAFQQALKAADEGTAAQQVEELTKAAQLLSEDAASDWLFLLPNLMVADKGITGLPKNAIAESFDLSQLARS
ncbi:MAG: ABC transporter substrate-binding protein [Actinobacteria bacterium]|nr:ABC transporter substrate-binding protein [Actinomycetota bacterium]